MALQAVGVDGWKGRWIAVVLVDGRFDRAEVAASAATLASAFPDAAAIGVDMPIGLGAAGVRRLADAEARSFVGARRASVFDAPSADDLGAQSHQAAIGLARAAGHRAVSAQAYALGTAILAIDAAARADARLREVHPEVSFRAMAGAVLGHTKKSWAGIWERLALLQSKGIEVPRVIGPAGLGGVDDVLDAAAAAWSAHRIAEGIARSLPDPPQLIDGRSVAIWY